MLARDGTSEAQLLSGQWPDAAPVTPPLSAVPAVPKVSLARDVAFKCFQATSGHDFFQRNFRNAFSVKLFN